MIDKKKYSVFFILVFASVFLLYTSLAWTTNKGNILWGFTAHKSITKYAILTLPQEMGVWYKNNIDYIVKHSVDPDKRRFLVKNEAYKHYIDFELYGSTTQERMSIINLHFDTAKQKIGENKLIKQGILPWQLLDDFYDLVYLMKRLDSKGILKITADLSHYIADAHVPLHTTENYDGQLTNQNGIHGLWETQIVENWDEAKLNSAYFSKPKLIIHIKDFFHSIIIESHSYIPIVLGQQTATLEQFNDKVAFTFKKKGKKMVKSYNSDFLVQYEKNMNDLTFKRWVTSVNHLRNVLYTAWQYAGKPNLDSMQ